MRKPKQKKKRYLLLSKTNPFDLAHNPGRTEQNRTEQHSPTSKTGTEILFFVLSAPPPPHSRSLTLKNNEQKNRIQNKTKYRYFQAKHVESDPEVDQRHTLAIWRLFVSVTPPLHSRWERAGIKKAFPPLFKYYEKNLPATEITKLWMTSSITWAKSCHKHRNSGESNGRRRWFTSKNKRISPLVVGAEEKDGEDEEEQ